ncbi:pentapeptide repeat-containing protein [Nocardia salmonicida]|uniref:pentapeptide repeat-containing protein n=1 Tax=Nocardia salmonicida TaxID=53431 RepID=UPI00369F2214
MSEGEKVAAGSPDEKHQQLARSELVSMPARSFWIGIALVPIGASMAGFGAAALSGVDTSFSQPLATIIGGAGVLTAGILTYINGQRSRVQAEAHHGADAERERERHGQDSRRERDRHAEDSRRTQVSSLRDRYTAIAAQIAHESAAIRQAGVYALASLADDWATFKENDERQVCIDLLQWYLRVPFPGGGNSDKPDLPEREIRRTIVRLLTERRRLPASDPKSWSRAVISLEQASLPGCALGGFNFVGIDLSGANLKSAYLVDANLSGVDLRDSNLADAQLGYADLTEAILKDADLTGAHLASAVLNSAELTDAILVEADLLEAKLRGADLSGVNLSGADLTDADLTGVKTDQFTVWKDKNAEVAPVDPLAD